MLAIIECNSGSGGGGGGGQMSAATIDNGGGGGKPLSGRAEDRRPKLSGGSSAPESSGRDRGGAEVSATPSRRDYAGGGFRRSLMEPAVGVIALICVCRVGTLFGGGGQNPGYRAGDSSSSEELLVQPMSDGSRFASMKALEINYPFPEGRESGGVLVWRH